MAEGLAAMTPARTVRDRALAMRAQHGGMSIATDTTADPVLIGFASAVNSGVIAVDKREYDAKTVTIWPRLLEALGVTLTPPTAMERAQDGLTSLPAAPRRTPRSRAGRGAR